jgi:hypothetical protein
LPLDGFLLLFYRGEKNPTRTACLLILKGLASEIREWHLLDQQAGQSLFPLLGLPVCTCSTFLVHPRALLPVITAFSLSTSGIYIDRSQ